MLRLLDVRVRACVCVVPDRAFFQLDANNLSALPREIGQLSLLTNLSVRCNGLAMFDPEQGTFAPDRQQPVDGAASRAGSPSVVAISLGLTNERCGLVSLRWLTTAQLRSNRLAWLPVELEKLPPNTAIYLHNNPLIEIGFFTDAREWLSEILTATTRLGTIRDVATTLCIGLADLDLPALVQVEILDAAWLNNIRMAAKWDLVVAVKHWHQRHSKAAAAAADGDD